MISWPAKHGSACYEKPVGSLKGAIIFMKQRRNAKPAKMPLHKLIRKHWMLFLMLLPAILYVVVFSYIPMTGIVLAFKKYNYNGGIDDIGKTMGGDQKYHSL